MKRSVLGICICSLLILTTCSIPATATVSQRPIIVPEKTSGINGFYKSLAPIPSPDGTSHECIMFCHNNKATLDWVNMVKTSGFEKAWETKFARVTLVLLLPGSILWFGLESFRNWYAELFLELRYKTEFEQFLQTYDTVNGTGMITYLWLSGASHRPVDFKAQPDNTWVPNSWIPDNLTGAYKPNPAIWGTLFFWYFP